MKKATAASTARTVDGGGGEGPDGASSCGTEEHHVAFACGWAARRPVLSCV